MGRPKEHDEHTAEALLDAAELLLAEGGPDAITVRAVAESVGTTTRAVYSVFGSKAGLLQGLATRGYRLLTAYVSGLRATDDPAADLVNAGVRGFRRFARERPQLFRLTFERVPPDIVASPDVGPAAIASYDALVRWVRRAQDAKVIDGRPEGEIAFAFHALCQGLASGELAREPPPVGANFWRHARHLDAEHIWRMSLEALVAGMAPGRPSASSPRSPRRRRGDAPRP